MFRIAIIFAVTLAATPARADDAESRAACEKLLPAASVAKSVGKPVKVVGKGKIGLVMVCHYVAGETPLVIVQQSRPVTKAQYDMLYVKNADGDRTAIFGVADEAFAVTPRSPPGAPASGVGLRKGDAALLVSSGLDPATARPAVGEKALVEMARTAAARL